MAREITPEMRAAMQRGGQWLRRARESAGFATVTGFAEALGIKQVRLSTYERGQYQVEPEIARRIAEVLRLSELTVWLGLELPLPRDLTHEDIRAMSKEEVIAYVERLHPGAIAAAIQPDPEASAQKSPPKRHRRGKKAEDVVQSGESDRRASRG